MIARQLEALNLKVWFDAELRSGTSFDREIDRNVRSAKCVLVCWSPGAVESDWVRGEATIGRHRGVLAAVILKECDLPSPFNLVHAEHLRSELSAASEGWLRTLERIGELVGRRGLASYAALERSSDVTAYITWLADNRNDPLFDAVAQRLKRLG